MKKAPLALLIIDGFGEAPPSPGNAAKLAKTPNLTWLKANYPNILLNASGKFVGLPEGQMGNSEVGHLNIGAGRIVKQSLTLIDDELAKDKLVTNKVFKAALKHAKKNHSKINLFVLASDGGVHSHINHLIFFYKQIIAANLPVVVHAFTDGRDVGQKSAKKYLNKLLTEKIKIASISGRYYAMNRNKDFDLTLKAYDVIVNRRGLKFNDVNSYIDSQYANNITDEYFTPAYFEDNPNGQVVDGDVIIALNFRSDRLRQLSHMFVASDTKITNYQYQNPQRFNNLFYCSTRPYPGFDFPALWPQVKLKNLFGEILEANNLTQLRAAESEKYPHVTFFFDGLQEIKKTHEQRIVVPSPAVKSYDLAPEMSCEELTKNVLTVAKDHDVLIINFAQPDMVGHTGVIEAIIKAVEIADKMVKVLYDKIVIELGGRLIITSDHGNCEQNFELNSVKPATKHTTNPVNFLITDKNISFNNYARKLDKANLPVNAKLADIAPTLLTILKIKGPQEMTGKNLLN